MSKRVEDAALKAYPKEMISGESTLDGKYDGNATPRYYFIKGYEQAEKDIIERACDMLMNYVFEEVTPEMRDHFRKRLEEG